MVEELSINKQKGSSQPTTEEYFPGNELAIADKEYNYIPEINGFSPNEPETKGFNTSATPAENQEEIALTDIKRKGLPIGKAKILASKLGIGIVEWHFKKDIKGGLKDGVHIVVDGGFIHSDTGDEIKHCMVLVVTDGKYEFFDPMGQQDILQKGIGVPVKNNYVQYQVQGYYTCFLHVMYYLIQRVNLGSMKKVLESYPSNKAESLYLNEEHVDQFIKESLILVD